MALPHILVRRESAKTEDWFQVIQDYANLVYWGNTAIPVGEFEVLIQNFTYEYFSDAPDLRLLAHKFARDAARSLICLRQTTARGEH